MLSRFSEGIDVQKHPATMSAYKVNEVVQGVAEAGEPLELLRDINYWFSKMESKRSKTEKRERAKVLMRSQGSLEVSRNIENILRHSSSYKEEDISAHLDWARGIYEPSYKRTNGANRQIASDTNDSEPFGSSLNGSVTSQGVTASTSKDAQEGHSSPGNHGELDEEIWRNFRIETYDNQLDDIPVAVDNSIAATSDTGNFKYVIPGRTILSA